MIKLEATFTSFGSRSDGSARLSFTTQELEGADFAELKDAQNQYGWLLFSENDVNLKDLPKEDAEDKNKTPSKRLRATLFVLWKQTSESGDFDAWYRIKMEKLIDIVKAKLDD